MHWMIGDIRVDRVSELEGPLFPPGDVFPDYDAAVLRRHWDELVPMHYNPEAGRVIGAIQSYILRTGSSNILIDTCCGNAKQRPDEPPFHNLDTPYLKSLQDLGLEPEDIDVVLCTHLHVDHVGWNTRLEDGHWRPTFRNARYLFSETDLDFVIGQATAPAPASRRGLQYEDSIKPVIEAGQAHLLTEPSTLAPGLEIEFCPGHTPGHVLLRATSHGETGCFIGDVVQHPLQVFRPDWNSHFCALPAEARASRDRVLTACAEKNALVFATHFASPYAFRVGQNGNGYTLLPAAAR